MSIGKRLINVVRANINSVLERSTPSEHSKHAAKVPIEKLSDEELEAELERRRARREAAERAANGSFTSADWDEVEQAVSEGAGRYRRTGRRSTGHYRRPNIGGSRKANPMTNRAKDPRMAQFYAQLECPYGADITTVRKQYRTLMRKYHPDLFSNNPDKLRIATELSQKLTMAYNELRRALGNP